MSSISKYKNGWFLILFILIGIVLGGLIAEITSGIPALSWLSYGQSFGAGLMESPVSIQIKITIASIIGVILAIVIYKFI